MGKQTSTRTGLVHRGTRTSMKSFTQMQTGVQHMYNKVDSVWIGWVQVMQKAVVELRPCVGGFTESQTQY